MRRSKNSSKISGTRLTPSLNPVMKYNDILRIERKALFEQKIAEFAIILELNGYSDCLKIR